MSDAPTSAISPLLIIIVIFVVVIIFFTLGGETKDQILGIFDQAFFGDEKDAQEAELATVESQTSFVENIASCDSGGKYNPSGNRGCYCLTESFGKVADGSMINIQNSLDEDKVVFTVLTENGAPLSQETKAYNLGLFAVLKEGDKRSLVCLYPSSFDIRGVDETDEYGADVNHWYVYWEESLAKRGITDSIAKRWESGDNAAASDYWFGFYREKAANADYVQDLENTPILYRTSAEDYCLLTDLIEIDIEKNKLPANTIIESMHAEIGTQEGFVSPSTDFTDVIAFFKNEQYCKKKT